MQIKLEATQEVYKVIMCKYIPTRGSRYHIVEHAKYHENTPLHDYKIKPRKALNPPLVRNVKSKITGAKPRRS